jgi:hypothetical protein
MSPKDWLVPYLETLSQRQSWRVNELTADFTERVLSALDETGWIEFRIWLLEEKDPKPFVSPKPEDRVPMPFLGERGWFSPIRNRTVAGNLSAILSKRYDDPRLYAELRVTESGRNALEGFWFARAQQLANSGQAALSIEDAIQSLTDRDRGVLRTVYDFEHEPYPNEPEKLEGCDELYAPQPKSITPVPWYLLKGAHWPDDPSPSLLALTRLGLIQQPEGVYHRGVHCRLPSGRVLRVEYKLERAEAASNREPSHFVAVYVDGRDEFCEDSATWVAKPNAYVLTSFGLRVARRLFANNGIGTLGADVSPIRNANADKEYMSSSKALTEYPIPGVATDKQRANYLRDHPEIRTRKPSKQRLEVHIADWINAKNAATAAAGADPSPEEIERQKNDIRKGKTRAGK